ncbi:dispatched homolog 3 [Seminavis robusta]|uniref:Dispatched homolog 3 n=1 Tax=Seminavis robusta TaxID=568900 RepID=A0A9N8DSM6_9STRA|nr:dispatched homolog 3 [Seminavis robusta]|eukprot:Sro342_g121680.1 dispatched homolog 3 (1283) ;mRNA; r:15457-19689
MKVLGPTTTNTTNSKGKKKERRHSANIQVGSMAFDLEIPTELEEAARADAQADANNANGNQKKKRKSIALLLEDEEFLMAKDGADVEVWFPIRRIHSHPRQCCAIMCGMWILSFGALILLSVAFGTIAFDIGVPFYDRSEINEQREDAYAATQRDADYVATVKSTADGSSKCVHEAPTILTRNGTLVQGPPPGTNCQRATQQRINILYISTDRTSNILTSDKLTQIHQIEQEFLARQQLSQYCYLVPSNYTAFTTRDPIEIVSAVEASANATEFNHVSCARINSVLNHMDPLFFDPDSGLGYHLLVEDVVPQEYTLTQDYIDDVAQFWSNYTTETYDLTPFPAAVQTVGQQIVLPNIFHQVVSSDYTLGSTKAIGVISSYDMGLPLNGYSSSSQATVDQYADAGTWLWEEYDEFLKNAGFDGVEVYFSDTEGAMMDAETGYLAIQSFLLFPASLLFVLIYLIYMQDSFFIGFIGVMQIMLCFIPGLILYRYVFQVTYLGVLNLIAVYIILGIGVDDLFVFCDQWKHRADERRFDQRLQKTFNVASRAMFTTSATTFISFVTNVGSVFPAVSCFGLFAAILVLVNFCAITMFFPAAFGMYYKHIRTHWWDHPSRILCCQFGRPWTDDVYDPSAQTTSALGSAKQSTGTQKSTTTDQQDNNKVNDSKEVDPTVTATDKKSDQEEEEEEESEEVKTASNETTTAEDTNTQEEEQPDEHHVSESRLVTFFRDTWAPIIIKLRFPIVLLFIGVFVGAMIIAARLEPDESAPNTLPSDNVYSQYTDILLKYFARSGNPQAINSYWISGINPDEPIDRTGTSDTNTTDYGRANYVDCSTYNPTTPEAQVWALKTCQDMFWGNVTEFHGASTDFGIEGKYGPRQRKILTDRVPYTDQWYYSLVSCPHQGMRDWLLTDAGCNRLTERGLPCHNETAARPNCVTWDTNGNSCEPYPVPSEHYAGLLEKFLTDPNMDATTRLTNYDKYFREIFIAEEPELDDEHIEKILQKDFSCRRAEGLVLLAMSSTGTLDQSFEQNYEDGLELYERWDEWSIQMRKFAPQEMKATMQTSNGVWSYYFLNETLIGETYRSIGLAMILSFIILSLVGGNPIMAFFSVGTIFFIVVDVFAFTVLMGWKLGVLEAVNYVVVIGLSIDYTVHLSEAYTESRAKDRRGRVIKMVEEMAVSVLSGAISTLGATFFMFFAPNLFFVKFAAFIFATIILSCLYALTFFPALLSIVGPVGEVGNVCYWIGKRWRKFRHKETMKYLETEQFSRRELAERVRTGEITDEIWV